MMKVDGSPDYCILHVCMVDARRDTEAREVIGAGLSKVCFTLVKTLRPQSFAYHLLTLSYATNSPGKGS
jgi:hypothetical protein